MCIRDRLYLFRFICALKFKICHLSHGMHARIRSSGAMYLYFFSCHFLQYRLQLSLNGLLCISLNLPSAVSAAIVLQYHFIIYHVFSPFILQQYNTFSRFPAYTLWNKYHEVSICQTFLICKKPRTEAVSYTHLASITHGDFFGKHVFSYFYLRSVFYFTGKQFPAKQKTTTKNISVVVLNCQ